MVAASVLAEFGAEAIKVEPPDGDPLRLVAPEGIMVAGTGLPFHSEARIRRFVTLDADDPDGRDVFRRLALSSPRTIGGREGAFCAPGTLSTANSCSPRRPGR